MLSAYPFPFSSSTYLLPNVNECQCQSVAVAVALAVTLAVAEEVRDGCHDDLITSYFMSPLCCHYDHSISLL
jgi:hypothetical protein